MDINTLVDLEFLLYNLNAPKLHDPELIVAMNWNAIVQKLGWQDVIAKWDLKDASACREAQLTSEIEGVASADIEEPRESEQGKLCGFNSCPSPTSRSELEGVPNEVSKKRNTNPFLDDYEDSELGSLPEQDSNIEKWFYLDPDENAHGPFDTMEMSKWYEAGYFDGSLRVKKAGDKEYVMIEKLISRKSDEIASMLSLTDLIPREYIAHIASFINPFNEAKQVVKRKESCSDETAPKTAPTPQKYSFNICNEMKNLSLKPSSTDCRERTPSRAPIKFTLSAAKDKTPSNTKAEATIEAKYPPPSKSLTEKMDKLQKYWQDVASTKLSDGQHARLVRIELMGKRYDAVLEPEARVSCLGAGSIQFLEHHKIAITKYTNGARTIKYGTSHTAKITGHVNITVVYQNATIADFKMLVVPDLDYFLYLGSDFRSHFTQKKVSLPPGLRLNRVNSEPVKFSRELKPTNYFVLREIEDLFPDLQEEGLGLVNLEAHRINISNPLLPFQSPVVLAKEDPFALQLLDKMLACDVLEASTSPWKLTVLPVCSGKQECLCIDLRRINALIQPDCYEMPSKENLLKELKRSNYISCIELSFLEWQIPLEEESRKYTTFEMSGHSYQFKRMPCGLKNGRKRIRRLLDKVLPRNQYALVSNTLIIYSQDFEPHTMQLARVADKFRKCGLKANMPQSSFCSSAVKCFGFVVGSNSQQLDEDASKAVSSINCPKTKHRLKMFLQILEWYRVLIPRYDEVTSPLLLLSKGKNDNLQYSPAARDAFAHAKRVLISEKTLCKPNYQQPFYVQCNVNFEMMAGLLYQLDSSGRHCAIAYCVKELTKQQQQYAISELECLSVVTCVKIFQPYIEDERFVVVTDKSILSSILNHDQLPLRLLRWCMALQAFDFTVQQRLQAVTRPTNVLDKVDHALLIKTQNVLRRMSACPICEILGQKIKAYSHDHLDYKVDDCLVYCRREFNCGDPLIDRKVWKLVVSESVAAKVVQEVHIDSFGHHRRRKEMEKYLASEFYWPEMAADVQRVVRNCKSCWR